MARPHMDRLRVSKPRGEKVKNSPLLPSSGLSVETKQIPGSEPVSSQEEDSFTVNGMVLQIKTDL